MNKYIENNGLEFYIYVAQNKNLKAIEKLERMQLLSLTQKYSFNIAKVYNDFGMDGIFRELILSELKFPDGNTLILLAEHHAFLGENQEALTYIEKMYETRNRSIIGIGNNVFFKDLRSEPRFQAILKKMRLDD